MIQLGLIGYPLGHSLSPKIHSAAFKACGLQGGYSLFPIHPDASRDLGGLLDRVRSGEIQGLNVTIPYKQTVIPMLDELTPTARAIGAINIIYLRQDKLIGDNTDAPGFLSDLKRFLTTKQGEDRGKKALVLGAGGSARAVVYALLNDGWHVSVTARRIEQARELVTSFENRELCIADHLSKIDLAHIDLLVNTTPAGMAPNVDQSPWPEDLDFPNAAIYDLVYNPRETKLVRNARSHGLSAITGLGMLIEQAALAFEVWTGHNPPRDVLFQALSQQP